MPIFEYKCRKCGEPFEAYRGVFDSDARVKCPKCGVKNPLRVPVAAGKAGRGDVFFPR